MLRPSRLSALQLLRFFRRQSVCAQAIVLLGLIFQSMMPVLADEARHGDLPGDLARALAVTCAIAKGQPRGPADHAQQHDCCCIRGGCAAQASLQPVYDPGAALAVPAAPLSVRRVVAIDLSPVLPAPLDPGRPPHAPPAG